MQSEDPLISYSQNLEDVILWRLLVDVDSGFYIDLGAQHPVNDSVTHAFYERGWSGINVEPNQDFLNLLNVHRPRDTNLGYLVGSSTGTSKFYRTLDGSGLSTGVLEIAKNLESQSTPIEIETKEVKPLSEICETYVKGDIHFLKIDVEGMELDVILGTDFKRFRPWIILLEAFEPNSRIETHEECEAVLLENRYIFVYADGLNRFYLAEEKHDLRNRFNFPPNVFDNYKLSTVVDRDVRIGVLERSVVDRDVRIGVLERSVVDRDVRIGVLERSVVDRDVLNAIMEQSLTWKLSKPIRTFVPAVMTLNRLIVKFLKNAKNRFLAFAVLPVIRELQMRPEVLRRVSNFAKQIHVYNFLLNQYLRGEKEWTSIQIDKSIVFLGNRVDPEKWIKDANEIRKNLSDAKRDSPGDLAQLNRERKEYFSDDVGVIVSLYQCEPFLNLFLESLKQQTIFSESQIYIGCVQPSELEFAALDRFRIENENVIFDVYSHRAGIYEVWNQGVQKTSSQFLTNMNVDDLRKVDSLEQQATFLKRFTSVDVVYQDVYLSFEANADWGLIEAVGMKTSLPHVSLPLMSYGVNPPHNAPMWRRRVHEKVGMFDETYKSAGDFDFWARALVNGCSFLKMGGIHASYFFNHNGISTEQGGAGIKESERVSAFCHKAMNQIYSEIEQSGDSANIKRYGLVDGMTLDLNEAINSLTQSSRQ